MPSIFNPSPRLSRATRRVHQPKNLPPTVHHMLFVLQNLLVYKKLILCHHPDLYISFIEWNKFIQLKRCTCTRDFIKVWKWWQTLYSICTHDTRENLTFLFTIFVVHYKWLPGKSETKIENICKANACALLIETI